MQPAADLPVGVVSGSCESFVEVSRTPIPRARRMGSPPSSASTAARCTCRRTSLPPRRRRRRSRRIDPPHLTGRVPSTRIWQRFRWRSTVCSVNDDAGSTGRCSPRWSARTSRSRIRAASWPSCKGRRHNVSLVWPPHRLNGMGRSLLRIVGCHRKGRCGHSAGASGWRPLERAGDLLGPFVFAIRSSAHPLAARTC